MSKDAAKRSPEELSMARARLRQSREAGFARYLAIASGDGASADLDDLVAPNFVGHMGDRTRDIVQLKRDMSAYRASADGVRFHVEQQFGEGDFLATRVVATAVRRSDGAPLVARGINVSRWAGSRLAEEWAVWEPLHPAEPAD
jgi:SnoaL-like domain